MLEDAVFVIFTVLSLAIVLGKLLNVLQFGSFYDPEWSIVTFVGGVFSFMFIMFMVLSDAGTHPELISYLWGHIIIFTVLTILFICEVLLWFFVLIPKKKGSEKYGDRKRLTRPQ